MTPEEKLELEKATKEVVEKSVRETMDQIIKDNAKSVTIVSKNPDVKKVDNGGYDNAEEFFHDVKSAAEGRRSEKIQSYETALKAVVGMSLTAADGGFLVPVEYANILNERSLALEIVRPRATPIPMGATTIKISGLDDYDRTDAAKGGPLGTVVAEGGATPAVSNLAFEQITLTPIKIIVDVATTPELEEDSPQSVLAIINAKVPARMSQKIDAYFLTGTGTGIPLGAFHANNNSRILVAKAAGQTRATTPLVLQNVTDMYTACKNPTNGVYVTGRAMYSALIALGSTYFLPFSINNNILSTPPGMLLGRPVLLTGKMAPVGTVGDIGFADFSQYYVGQRGGIRTASSIHVYWATDQNAYRFVIRLDGKPAWTTVETLENSEVVSPFNVLAGD